MNRTDFQQLAEERIRDAEALLSAGQWSGAYYLAGYAVECGLKACIAKLTNLHDFPNKELVSRCYSHNIEDLVQVAGMKVQRNVDAAANPALGTNWLTVKDWDEKARYQLWTEVHARTLFAAAADSANGVLQWIKARW